MVDTLTPDGLAEAIERARFALLRQGKWAELREGERQTRVEILRNAMDTSGVTMRLQALELRAQQSGEIADLLARRDADFKRRLAADDAEIVRLGDAVATLNERLATATAERDAATAHAAEHGAKLEAIRDALDGIRATPTPDGVPSQAHAPVEKASPAARRAPRRTSKSPMPLATGS